MKVNWAVPLPAPAGIVSVKSGTAWKSAAWAVAGSTEIVSAVASALGKPSTVAVTVISAGPPYSRTVDGEMLKVAAPGGASSSVMVTAWLVSVPGTAPVPAVRLTLKVSDSSAMLSSAMLTLMFLRVSLAANTRLVAATAVKSLPPVAVPSAVA